MRSIRSHFRRTVKISTEYIRRELGLSSKKPVEPFFQHELRVFKNYPCPRAMCVIDDQIVYVAFYEWAHHQGTQAPAVRLDASGAWGQTFLRETALINDHYSDEGQEKPKAPN